jgi:hypothetical protein
MRKYALPILLALSNAVIGQNGTTGVEMGQDFQQLAKDQSNFKGSISPAAFQSYSSRDVNGSQYFFPNWHKGEVVTTRKEVFNNDLLFIYDKVRQELFIRKNDTSLILLANKDEIQSFTLKGNDGKEYNFVNSSLFTESKPEVFYQVLEYDSTGFSLLKYIKTVFEKADHTDLMKEQQGNIYDSFIDNVTYYVVDTKHDPQPVQLKTKSIRKALSSFNIDADKYLNSHPASIDESYLIGMIKFFNLK